jgi:hypothetical protein
MKRPTDKNKTTECNLTIHRGVDSHKWATKMEICRLLSAKPDLKLEAVEKQTA